MMPQRECPESFQNPPQNEATNIVKNDAKSGGAPKNDVPSVGGATSGSVGIWYFAVLEEVIPWISLHFSIFSVGAAPIS